MTSRVISAVLKFKDQNFSSGLRQANKEAGEFGRYMNVAQNKIEDFNKAAGNAFKAVGVAAGSLAVSGFAVLSASVTSSVVEMESAYSKLSAQTGAVGHELEEYKAIAESVFTKGFGDSISEATDAVGKFANMFKDLDYGELSTVTEGSFTIAKTFNQEATEVGRAVKALKTNFKELSASDATDLITVAFRETGDYANDLLDTFSEYSGYFADVGMTGEQFTSTLIKGAKVGAWNIDKVGDAVKEFSIRSIDGSKATEEGFKAIGLNADDMASKIAQGGETANQAYMATIAGLAAMKDPVEQNAAGVALFGTMWEDLRDDVVLAMSDSTSAVEGYKGATEEAANTLNSGPIARMKNAWRDLTVQLANLGSDGTAKSFMDNLATTVENTVPKVVDLADKAMSFANTIRNNWGPISTTVLTAAAAIGTFKVAMTAMTIVSTVAGFIKTFRAALVAGTIAQWAMNTAMLASPFTWVAIAIAAVVAAGVLLWRNWDTIKEKAGGLWAKTKEVFGGIYEWGANKIKPVTNFFSSLKDTFDKFKSAIKNFKLPEWVTTIGSKISGAASTVKGWFKGNSYDVGSNRITHDQIAQIHKDEMIIPARQAQKVRAAGGNIDNIDKLVSGGKTSVTSTTNNNSKVGNSYQFGNIIVNGMNKTSSEIAGEIVYEVKLALANM